MGTLLIKEKSSASIVEPNNKMKKTQATTIVIIAVLVVIAIALIVFASITGNVAKECKDVQVPYEEQEEYIKTEYYPETVPYQKDVPLAYEEDVVSETSDLFECSTLTNHRFCSKIGVFNKDVVGGIFKLNCNFEALNRDFSDNDEAYIKPGESEIFTCVADINVGEDVKLVNYEVIAPTKQVTDYKEVQRERQVTAYKPVTKYKTEEQCD